MADRYYEPSYFTDYPPLPLDIAEYLVECRVSMVGVDMCSVDYEPFAVHQTLLRGDVLILENLTGLERVAGRDFRVYALPLRLAADGAPVRGGRIELSCSVRLSARAGHHAPASEHTEVGERYVPGSAPGNAARKPGRRKNAAGKQTVDAALPRIARLSEQNCGHNVSPTIF